jgi:hypothetical protein
LTSALLAFPALVLIHSEDENVKRERKSDEPISVKALLMSYSEITFDFFKGSVELIRLAVSI